MKNSKKIKKKILNYPNKQIKIEKIKHKIIFLKQIIQILTNIINFKKIKLYNMKMNKKYQILINFKNILGNRQYKI